MPDHDALERSQKKLYLSIKAELALYEKAKNREIAAYEKTFRSHLPRKGASTNRKSLFQAAAGSTVALVGDFHPFRQSQKSYLRLAEECAKKNPRMVLALECLQQAHQLAVNEYLAGLVTLEELRDKIDFEKYWPFPWENYKEILQFAKLKRLPVLALNILERKRSSMMLRERDRAAAEKIGNELDNFPQSAVFVLYGELHLARPHLPHDLRIRLGKSARITLIHQNVPELYWSAPRLKNGQKPEVLRLAADEFCILSSVPWVKLRSYLDWLEGSPDSEGWDDLDAPGIIHHYARLLADAIGIKVNLRDELEIFTADRLNGRLPASFKKKLSRQDALFAAHSLQFQRTAYLPEAGAILLPTTSTNAFSEAASWLLWHSIRSSSIPSPSTVEERISHFFVGYLGSKVLNPKRKCNEVADLKKQSSSHSQRALGILRPYLKGERLPSLIPPLRGAREMEACRLSGFVLAERFFLSLLSNPDLLALLRTWFECSSSATAKALLIETAARIRAIAPASKSDRF